MGRGGGRGVHLGPFSASDNTRSPALGALILLVGIVALIQNFWPVGFIVFVIGLALVAASRKHRVAELERRQEGVRQWLAAPAPPLVLPARFSETWFAANVPQLHPGQVSVLFEDMRARGWTDARIQQRVGPYLARKPFLQREANGELSLPSVRSTSRH